MRTTKLLALAAAALLVVLGCGKAPCQAVTLTSEWKSLPLSALKEGTVCRSGKDDVMVWRRGDVAKNADIATKEMESAGFKKTKQDIGSANYHFTYKKGADSFELNIYDFDGTGMIVRRVK